MNKILTTATALLFAQVSFNATASETRPLVEVYKSASCGCCKQWIQHLEKNGFEVEAHNVSDVSAARQALGMPQQLGACHTAKVGNYLVEGHVPAADIRKLLKQKPDALGIAVPGMPPGSPGMESPNPVHYDTLLVGKDGKVKVFSHH